MNLFSMTWEDAWAFDECPRKLAANSQRALRLGPYFYRRPSPLDEQYLFDDSEHGLLSDKMPEEEPPAKIPLPIPSRVRNALKEQYGEIQSIWKGEARHPDLVSCARPDFIAITSSGKPVIVEVKKSEPRNNEQMEFKARFYNGLAASEGLFVVEHRSENGFAVFAPKVIRERSETFLVYPSSTEVITETYPVSIGLVKGIASAKQLGYRGKCPPESCGSSCDHNRIKLKLAVRDYLVSRPLPLVFCEILLRKGFDFDRYYMYKAGGYIDDDYHGRPWEYSGADLLKVAGREGTAWKRMVGEVAESTASRVYGKGRSIYSLPQGSSDFLQGSLHR